MPLIDQIKEKIYVRHEGDSSQLNVIFSPERRLLVEAPAGYGKTNTMVSRIAFMLMTQQIPYPKKLLALTFSVNASYKMKKDVNRLVPEIFNDLGIDSDLHGKVIVSNYHGFCRSILKKYGYLLQESLPAIDTLQPIDDNNSETVMKLVKQVTYEEAQLLSNFNEALKNTDSKAVSQNFQKYNDIVITKLLSEKIIPYNAILTLTIKLLIDYPKIQEFYQQYFTAILVDEFQDTNLLAYMLLSKLINTKTKVILLGDSLQRIYGFIGAVPELLPKSVQKFALTKYVLQTNHRFASNPQMLQLDSNIRKNAENPVSPTIETKAEIELVIKADQASESSYILKKALIIAEQNPDSKIAILVRQRGPNVNQIISSFDDENVQYFFGLFTDEDPEYKKFHRVCLTQFINLTQSNQRITKSLANAHIKIIKELSDQNALSNSLNILLEIFWSKVFSDFPFFPNEEKHRLVRDTFEYNGLKQYIEFVPTNISISTIHAAKGLEWDYVILPDMEQYAFPSWYGLCGNCISRETCKIQVNPDIQKKFIDELSVFYVAVTRARRQVYFSASQTSLDYKSNERPCNISCFLNMPGIAYTIA